MDFLKIDGNIKSHAQLEERDVRKQKGNTLLEVLLVLAVSSVLLTLAVRYFNTVDLNRQVTEAISKIDIISRASYEWLSAERQGDFSLISNDGLITLGLVSEADMMSPWGGPIAVSGGDDLQHVKISLNGLGPAGCQNLHRHLLNIAYAESPVDQCTEGAFFGEF